MKHLPKTQFADQQEVLLHAPQSLRGKLCFAMSRSALGQPVEKRTEQMDSYQEWRNAELSSSWARFSDKDVNDRDVLDFGCGNGPLSLFLAETRNPKSITGVDLYADAIARAQKGLAQAQPSVPVEFLVGDEQRIPVADQSVDTLLAFDCLEHVMDPQAILTEWQRVLRPGGKALVEWFPFASPYGPHMEALIPVPWAQYLFGEKAMFEAAERIYDDPGFVPRHWDKDEDGNKLPNKWKAWRSFAEQAYVNELTTMRFKKMLKQVGFSIVRFERFGLASSRKGIGAVTGAVSRIPYFGEFITSYVIIEIQRD